MQSSAKGTWGHELTYEDANGETLTDVIWLTPKTLESVRKSYLAMGLTDEQIAYELTQTSSLFLAAANCCQRILAVLARKIDRNGAQFSAQRSQLFQHYTDLELKLRSQAATLVKPVFGGTSQDGRDSLESDDDYIPAAFNSGDFDNNGGGSSE
jgi:hypothetical protein